MNGKGKHLEVVVAPGKKDGHGHWARRRIGGEVGKSEAVADLETMVDFVFDSYGKPLKVHSIY